ncbi:MAG: DnaJ domain-containing protein [Phycisphaeraceae bacterium]|nr:DnaJ domain-containing protein [Phycisphaeraceae bacterium]
MPAEFKNYYDVLGVAKDASADGIKKAFRKLARLYHPDVAKDKITGEKKFKEINEAYEVLGDPEKRQQYDQLGADWKHGQRQPPPPQSGFGGGYQGASEVHFNGTGFSDFFEQYFGGRGHPSGGFNQTWSYAPGGEAVALRGQDIEGDILVTLDEVMHGSTRTIQLQRIDPRTRQSTTQTLQVKIPPGVREAQLIRLAGKGREGINGGEPGNLYLQVKLAQHPDFRVRGTDLYYDLELAPWEAVLGATVPIPTMDGTVSLKVPAATRTGRQLRLRGKGLPTRDGTRGHLYAVVSIQVPAQATADERKLWERMAKRSTFNPRKSS